MYWFPVNHFRCMKFKPLVIWIWYQNIAISTIVGLRPIINVTSCGRPRANHDKCKKSNSV
jgi:hypothetical protein